MKKMKKFIVRLAVVLLIVVCVAFLLLAFSAQQAGLSIPAQFLRVVLLPAVPMPNLDDADSLRAAIKESRTKGPALPSETFRAKFNVQQEDVNGQTVWTVAPRKSTSSGLYILYIPGSAYVNEVLQLHWDIAEQLIDRTDATLVMPFYPLAPEHDWQPAYAMIDIIYEKLVAKVGAKNLVIAGDSAGGGIALSLTQQKRDHGSPLPAALVLFSPWLDLTLSSRDQVELAKHDHILSMKMLRIAGEWWAGNLPTTDPRVSPLFGSIEGLPPIAVFTGTEDLLNPDAKLLAIKATEASVPITMFEYKNEFHDWVGLLSQTIPEATRALDQAAAFMLEHAAVVTK